MCSGSPIMTWLGSIFGYAVQFFYNIFNNYGVAIIFFTIFTRILMFPLTIKQQKSSAAQARLQPKLAQLKEKYGNNTQAYNEAMQELYTKEGVSPTAGCLPMIIQFPLFFGMYEAIRRPLTCVLHISKDKINQLISLYGLDPKAYYSEINVINNIKNGVTTAVTSASDAIVSASNAAASAADVVSSSGIVSGTSIVSGADIVSSADAVTAVSILGENFGPVQKMCNAFNFLGFDLLQTAAFWNKAIILAFIVFICQVLSMVISNKITATPATPGCSPNMMAVGMGAFSLFISLSVPAAFPLYWATSSILAPVQTWITKKYFGPLVMNAKAEAARNARLKLEEQQVIDEVNEKKGRIYLEPSKEKANASSGSTRSSGNGSAKKNGGSSSGKGKNGGKGSRSDYMGRKK